MKKPQLIAACLAALFTASSAFAQTFLWNTYNESTFNDAFASGNSVTVTVAANSRMTVFTSSFTPIALSAGTTRQVNFTLSATGGLTAADTSTTRAIYAGFFNTGGTSTGSTRFADDTGYLIRWNPGGASAGFLEYQERASGAVNSLYNGYTVGTNFGVGANGANITLADNTAYTFSLRLVRAAGGAFSFGTNNTSTTYGAAVSGTPTTYYGYTNTDTTPVTNFDQFAFMLQNTTGSAVTYTLTMDTNTLAGTYSAIPEPSTYAALAGLAALGVVMLRRRRAALAA